MYYFDFFFCCGVIMSGLFHLNIPGKGECHLFQTPSPIEKKIHPPPPEFTSINTPLPLERKKNHKNNFLYRNTQS